MTEVLQRILGVSIGRIQTGASVGAENFLAEGTGVQIRGLTSVLSLLNSRDTFSSVNSRILAFEDIPPELQASRRLRRATVAAHDNGFLG